jgi:hypothetical protein
MCAVTGATGSSNAAAALNEKVNDSVQNSVLFMYGFGA